MAGTKISQFRTLSAINDIESILSFKNLVILRQHINQFSEVGIFLKLVDEIFIQTSHLPYLVDVKMEQESNILSFYIMFYVLLKSLYIIISVTEHVHISKGPCRVTLTESIGSYLTESFVKFSLFQRLSRINLIIVIAWFNFSVNSYDVNIKCNVQQLGELFLSLLFQVKFSHTLILRVKRILVFVPGVWLESIKHIIISWVKVSMVVEGVTLGCDKDQ